MKPTGRLVLFCIPLLCASAAFAQEGTACCLAQGGCADSVPATECEEMGGQPFGACATCDEIECPNPGCIGATGDCNGPFETPGCDDLRCCTVLCQDQPHCCTEDFDESCGIACDFESPFFACCLPDGGCVEAEPFGSCYDMGGIPDLTRTECPGDLDGDGIDEACGCSGGDVPAVSGWKPLMLLALLLLAASLFWFRRRPRSPVESS